MYTILKVNNLNYYNFKNIDLSFEKNKFYFVIGGNKSGKTTLFRILSSLIITNNVIRLDNFTLNNDNRKTYVKQIGVVQRLNEYSFNYKKVKDEMLYPLINLGFNFDEGVARIKEILKLFNLDFIYLKNISELSYNEKQLLLVMISLLHHPKILLLDNVFEVYSKSDRKKIIEILKKLLNIEGITIINFTANMEDIIYSDRIIILNNFKVVRETTYEEIYNDDKLFYDNGLEIPFNFDLVNKLKMYGLINKNYTDMKDMVDDIWH